MLIVLDCPGCGKRYEIDAALAGKKSRCKQCGEVFRIPVPTAVSAPPPTSKPPRPAQTASGAGEWQTALVEPQRTAKPGHWRGAGKTEREFGRLRPEDDRSELPQLSEAVRNRRSPGRQEIALQRLRRGLLDPRAEGTRKRSVAAACSFGRARVTARVGLGPRRRANLVQGESRSLLSGGRRV